MQGELTSSFSYLTPLSRRSFSPCLTLPPGVRGGEDVPFPFASAVAAVASDFAGELPVEIGGGTPPAAPLLEDDEVDPPAAAVYSPACSRAILSSASKNSSLVAMFLNIFFCFFYRRFVMEALKKPRGYRRELFCVNRRLNDGIVFVDRLQLRHARTTHTTRHVDIAIPAFPSINTSQTHVTQVQLHTYSFIYRQYYLKCKCLSSFYTFTSSKFALASFLTLILLVAINTLTSCLKILKCYS